MIQAINTTWKCLHCQKEFNVEQVLNESHCSYKFFKPDHCPDCRNVKLFNLIGFEPRKIAFKDI